MTESSKKRKRNSNEQPNQTVGLRGVIDANWQKFLSSSLIMDKKTEKPAQENNKAQFSGTFRRARKKKAKDHENVQNMKTLNLASNADTLVNNVDLKKTSESKNVNGVVKNNNKNRITKFLAMDCEMVGVGYDGSDHMLARVSIVNKFGDCIYDKFVKAREEVKDYRTDISGVRKEDLLNGEDFTVVQKEVSELMKGRILVGHSLKNDLSVLFLSHPKRNIRDTSRYKPFRKVNLMDCEMVGVGYDGSDHMLARVSIVNKFGDCIYDKFVKAREEVKDYRTDISGVRKEDLLNGEDFTVVQKEVSELMKGRILVGHSLKNDLSVLFLSHPKRNIRDTSRYKPFRKVNLMDCEMVGVGYDGSDHMLARVSIVNKFGDCIYDKFVKAREEVKDYRTDISGVRKEDLLNGEDFTVVQKEVSELMKGRILVGHSLKNDLSVLFLSHPKRNIRDTSRYKPFRKITKGSTPSLKRLAKEILGIDIQSGEHSSVEDARAAMQLYCSVARQWEPTLVDKRGKRKVNPEDD